MKNKIIEQDIRKVLNAEFDKIPLKNDPLYKEGHAHTLPRKTAKDKKRVLRYAKERKKYGFDSTVTWSFDYEIAKYLVPRLIMFKITNNRTIPTYALSEEEQKELNDNEEELMWISDEKEKKNLLKRRNELYKKSHIEWEKIMNEMIEGFYSMIDYDCIPFDKQDEKQRKAVNLLSKYFFHLWD